MARGNYMTTDEAGRRIGRSGRAVRKVCAALGLRRTGWMWLVTEADLRRLRKAIGPKGRPRNEPVAPDEPKNKDLQPIESK